MSAAARDLAAAMEPVAKHLLGEPNSACSTSQELRFGSRGSLSVKPAEGTWYSHETGAGGGVLDLVIERGMATDRAGAATWLRANGFLAEANDNAPPRRPGARLVATYDYVDEAGEVLFQVCRMEPKDFRQRRPDGNGGWEWKVKGTRQVPYQLPQMLAADPAAPVFIVEGERDVEQLAAAGLVATCNAGGAGKWPAALAPYFRERRVVILPDNDAPGRDHAALVARALRGVAEQVRVLDLAAHWADMPPKGDVSDWLENAGTPDQLLALAGSAPIAACDNTAMRDEERRRRQREENDRLQELPFSILPPSMTVEDMQRDCVWIATGSQVGCFSNPRQVLTFKEFADLTASSATEVADPNGKAKPRRVPNAVIWKNSTDRITVYTRTFHAGAEVICIDPEGMPALNSWRPIERSLATRDVGPFIEQVGYLFADPVERAAFLDWLAHIEQHPGVLPHYGWLHIAANTGTGRNWLASVLARLWRGYVAPNVDLPALLESQFNGGLAGRLLAIVDEVQEGGGENPFRHANRLKSLVNAEYRDLNPKFGRQYREHNACRWLVFSNHENALPLNDTDRRWRVVHHEAPPRAPVDYSRLYALLDDADFINAVGVHLRERDISTFNPGERPPMNEAKRKAVAASKSLVQQAAEELIAHWPADIITNGEAAEILGGGQDKGFTPAMRRAMNEAGAAQYGDGRLVKVRNSPTRCWILRNVERWARAVPAEIAAEATSAREYDQTAMEALARCISTRDDEDRPF